MPRTIDDRISVAPQISAEDIPLLAEQGFTYVINNRPDDEEMGQPGGDTIRARRRRRARLCRDPRHAMADFSAQVEAMAGRWPRPKGPVLAYCRSGTRSCNLWALAEASARRRPRR
jgi:uncharacterized protein (TIGR01244 family)